MASETTAMITLMYSRGFQDECRPGRPTERRMRRLLNGTPPVDSPTIRPCPELALPPLRAVEGELRRLVVGEPRLPALLISRQPAGLALGAVRESDAFGAHAPTLRATREGARQVRLLAPVQLATSRLRARPAPLPEEERHPAA
jgi:hypothetical protein